jgi:hypothetical protein
MNLDVEAFLKDAKPSFQPWAHYHKQADSLQVYVADLPTSRRRVDDILTVYETPDGEFGGCMIKGVSTLLKECGGSLGFSISKGGKVKASLVIMAYVATHPDSLTSAKNLSRVLKTAANLELAAA